MAPLCQAAQRHRIIFCLLGGLLLCASSGQGKPNNINPAEIRSENPVPFGPGSSWVVGDQLLQAGAADQALPFLHMAYRAATQVPSVALAFQGALQANGYYDDALGVLDSLVADFPDSLRFRFKRAQLRAHMGQTKPALDDLAFLHDQAGVTPDMISLQASILSDAGQVAQALDVLQDGLRHFPEIGAGIYLGMASVLEKNGRIKDIPAMLREALGQYPKYPELHLSLIRTLARLDRPADALAAAVTADSLFHDARQRVVIEAIAGDSVATDVPGSFEVELADYHAHHGHLDRAMAILKALADQGRLDQEPSLWFARMLLGSGKADEGRRMVDSILQQWPESGRGWFLAGSIAENAELWPEAMTDFNNAVQYAPDDPEIRLGMVRAMMLSGADSLATDSTDSLGDNPHGAFKHQVRAASTLVPQEDAQGQLILGYAYRRLGDLENGAWHFQLAAADSSLHLNALIQASLCLDEAGKIDQARGVLEQLRTDYPRNPEIANSLGYFLAEKNMELAEAERLVQEALNADPSNGAYLDSMGWVKYRQGQIDQALDYLVRAANALPEDPVILEHLGVILAAQDRTDEARNLFQRALHLGGDSQRLQGRLHELDHQ